MGFIIHNTLPTMQYLLHNTQYRYHRVYSRFTLEAIVATAFGRQINLQRGESDEFSKAMDTAMKALASGQFENFTLIHSMHIRPDQLNKLLLAPIFGQTEEKN